MPRSVPVSVDIPAIDVHTAVMRLGLWSDGTVQVPPIGKDAPAGWYEGSPTPGQRGPAVLLGHVTVGDFGEGVFYRLAQLAPGAQIKVTRADGKQAIFTVQRSAEVPKDRFPRQEVYEDTDKPELRLITCGGPYDRKAHSYPDNIVVFATLTASG
ncbi:class F sortase [Streptomyces sp. RPT161]|uniref:class F sortase n=1 Tax=Streptomyces sp. RPT161 TaxID=3015993 RepID=UPI0022B8DB67|nr:class F sortase [Streptomyces sp. RPT161]